LENPPELSKIEIISPEEQGVPRVIWTPMPQKEGDKLILNHHAILMPDRNID
jgi:hypothetical protein